MVSSGTADVTALVLSSKGKVLSGADVSSNVVSGEQVVSGRDEVIGASVTSSSVISSSVTEARRAAYWLLAAAKTAAAETISAAIDTVMNAIMSFLVFILYPLR